MICSEIQLTGFYMMATLAFNELNKSPSNNAETHRQILQVLHILQI